MAESKARTGTKRKQASEKKRESICAAAEELFKTYGYDGTTLRDISGASGFSIGSLYNFFGMKENILLEIGKRLCAFSLDTESADARDPYPAIMQCLLAGAEKWESVGAELACNIYRTSLGDRGRLLTEPAVDGLAEFIGRAQGAGTFDASLSSEGSAAYIMTMFHGLVYEWCASGGAYSLREAAERVFPRMLCTFVK